MPSSGKATGAILLAFVGFVVSGMIAANLPVALAGGRAHLIVAALGLVFGWRIGGERRGGAGAAAARGVTAALVMALWALLAAAFWQMLVRAPGGRYDGPVEALGDVAALMIDYARLLADPAPAAILLLGGAAAGVVSAAVGRRWP
jgi:hypothetical protein